MHLAYSGKGNECLIDTDRKYPLKWFIISKPSQEIMEEDILLCVSLKSIFKIKVYILFSPICSSDLHPCLGANKQFIFSYICHVLITSLTGHPVVSPKWPFLVILYWIFNYFVQNNCHFGVALRDPLSVHHHCIHNFLFTCLWIRLLLGLLLGHARCMEYAFVFVIGFLVGVVSQSISHLGFSQFEP